MKNRNEINEAIADAMSEEETAKEFIVQGGNVDTSKQIIRIELDEYVALKKIETDHERLLSAILAGVELDCDGEALRIGYGKSENIIEAIRVLYRESYDGAVEALQEIRKRGEGAE